MSSLAATDESVELIRVGLNGWLLPSLPEFQMDSNASPDPLMMLSLETEITAFH